MKNADNASETVEQQKILEREIEATTQQLNKYEGELDKTKTSLYGMAQESSKVTEETKETSDALMTLAQSEAFSKIAEGAKQVYDTLMQCDEAADRFEVAMAKVNTLANAGDGISKWGEDIKNYAAALGVSATDFAEGVYQAMSASVAADDAIEFTAQMTKLAIGGFTDSATAVDVVTTALNAYGLEAEATSHIMDDLIATQNLGKTSVAELASAMGKVIPTAAAYGVDIDNLAAAYSELTAKGVKTKIATTQMNAMFQELGNSEKAVNEILLEMTGDTFGQFMEKGNSLGDVMKILWEYADEDKEAFLGMWDSSQAASAAFNLAADGGTRFSELLAEMSNNAGLADANFQMMADTGEMLDARMTSAIENLKIAIGDALGPVLDGITEKGLAFLEPFTEFVEQNPEVVAALSGMVMGVVGVTTAISACTAAIAIFKLALGDVSGLATILGGAALVGGLAGLSTAVENANSGFIHLKDNIKETKDNLETITTTYDDSTANVEDLATRIKDLNEVENLNAEQQIELASCVAQWNSAMDENNQLIIDNTGHVEGNTEALYANIDAALQAYELEQKKSELTEIITGYAEAQENLRIAEEQLADAEAELAKVTDDNYEAQWYWNDIVSEAKNTVSDAEQVCQSYSDRYQDLKTSIDGATESQKEYVVVAEDGTTMTKEEEEELKKLADAYDKAKESAISSLDSQRDEFEHFNDIVKTDVKDLKTSFEEQAKGMQEYAQLIKDAYDIMQIDPNSENLLQYYISQGPAAAGSLQGLVDAFHGTAEEVQLLNDTFAAFNETSELIELIGSAQAEIETGYTDPADNALASLQETIPLITETYANGYTEQQTNAEENKTVMVETATGTVTDMANAITTNAPLVSTATKTMMETAVKDAKTAIGYSDDSGRSSLFYDLGANIDQSIADGVTDNAGVIATALQGALDSAVNGLSLEGLSSIINVALGEALGG